ncbi:MAG: hypothetical protein EOP00_30730 [Pedobacter sp.]|nr:MAG: hypothetical protein EOP00_30730 [Pedobacter sp.]
MCKSIILLLIVNINGFFLVDSKASINHSHSLEKHVAYTINKSEQSGINTFVATQQQVVNLSIAAQFWGFLKYHHPAVAKGDFNWDAKLFELLPSIIASKNNVELGQSLDAFLNKLSQIPVCKSCKSKNPLSEIKPNYGYLINGGILSKPLEERLQYILTNADIKENHYVTFKGSAGNPLFSNEIAYESMVTPDAGYRLLSLFRYWNMVNYFFPYRDIIGADWNDVLKEMIPDFLAADSQGKYIISTMKMLAKINDTHAYFYGPNEATSKIRGKNTLPFRVKFVEDKLVVYDYFDTADSIKTRFKLGDEITEINGEKITDLIKKYEGLVAASNYDTKLRNLPLAFLARSNDTNLHTG